MTDGNILDMTMGDQKFTCGRHKNRTYEYVAQNEPDFCAEVLKTTVCNQYYPEDFKSYLISLGRPSLSEITVANFVEKWNASMKCEFQKIIGSPKIEIKQVHPLASNHPNGDLGVFIRYFIKKCIFNVQNKDASSCWIEIFARIFPFRVSETVPPAELPVRKLFDKEFYSSLAAFMVRHFEDKCDSVVDIVDLFVRNICHFKNQHLPEGLPKLKSVVDCSSSFRRGFSEKCTINYFRQFPRLSRAGVTRYEQLRQVYNELCAAYGLEGLGYRDRRHLRQLPEINCYELLQLLEPDFYLEERAKYIEWFHKYLFFFVNAIKSADDHPVFFIDDPLYECLKGYAEYQKSREIPEKLKACIWMVTLIRRRTQRLEKVLNFDVDDESLRHIRHYVENFPHIDSAVVDYALPTSLLHLYIPIVTKDTIFGVFYKKGEMSKVSHFHERIIKALMCDFNIEKIVIYNAHNGVEASMSVPALKKPVLEFIRRHNKYDPAQTVPTECNLTENLEIFFEQSTIQWNDKYPEKSNPVPVYDYEDIFCDA